MNSRLPTLALLLVLAGVASGETVTLDWPRAPDDIRDPVVFGAPEFRGAGVDEEAASKVGIVPYVLPPEAVSAILGEEVRTLGVRFAVSDAGVEVSGPSEATSLAVRRWKALVRFVTGRARVSVTLFSVPIEAGRLDPAELIRDVSKHPDRLVWSTRLETVRGVTSIRRALTSYGFVADQEAEVAQWAGIMAPLGGIVRTGRMVAVQCRPLSSREAVVTLSIHASLAPEGLEPITLHGGTIQLPRVRFLSATTEMRLSAGKPEVLLLPAPSGEGLLAAVVTVDSLPPDADRPEGLVDLVAAVGHPTATLPPLADGWREETGDYSPLFDAMLARQVAYEDRGHTVAEVTKSVSLVFDEEKGQGSAVGTPATVGKRLRRTVRRLPWADLLKRPDFDPIRGLVAPDAGVLSSRTVAPTHAGTPLLLVRGTWQRILATLEVEVAQGSALVDPEVRSLVTGEVLRARRGGDRTVIHRRTRTVLSSERRDPGVFKDVEGRRGWERKHFIDAPRIAETDARFLVGAKTVIDLRREGDSATVEVIEVK